MTGPWAGVVTMLVLIAISWACIKHSERERGEQ